MHLVNSYAKPSALKFSRSVDPRALPWCNIYKALRPHGGFGSGSFGLPSRSMSSSTTELCWTVGCRLDSSLKPFGWCSPISPELGAAQAWPYEPESVRKPRCLAILLTSLKTRKPSRVELPIEYVAGGGRSWVHRCLKRNVRVNIIPFTYPLISTCPIGPSCTNRGRRVTPASSTSTLNCLSSFELLVHSLSLVVPGPIRPKHLSSKRRSDRSRATQPLVIFDHVVFCTRCDCG